MKLIYRYIGIRLLRGYVLVGIAFWALFGLFEFMSRAEEVGVGRFTISDALLVSFMTMPARLIDMSHFIAMLGVIYGLSTLVRSNELTAMRSAGVTPARLIAFCAVATGAFMTVVGVAEIGARPISQTGEMMFMQKTSKDGALFSDRGIWTELGGGYLHIESLSQTGNPAGIYWYEFNPDRTLRLFRHAADAEITNSGTWLLRDVTETSFAALADTGGPRLVSQSLPAVTWSPTALQRTAVYQLPLQSLTLADLYTQLRLSQSMHKAPGAFGMEFWQRCLLPFSAIVFTLFGAPLVLGGGPRVGMGGIIVGGIAAAFLLYLAQQMISNVLNLLLQTTFSAVLLSILVVLLPGAWLCYKSQRGPA